MRVEGHIAGGRVHFSAFCRYNRCLNGVTYEGRRLILASMLSVSHSPGLNDSFIWHPMREVGHRTWT